MENEILEKFLCFPVSEVASQISNFSSYFVWVGLGQVNSRLGTTLFASLRFVGEIKFSRRFPVFQLVSEAASQIFLIFIHRFLSIFGAFRLKFMKEFVIGALKLAIVSIAAFNNNFAFSIY